MSPPLSSCGTTSLTVSTGTAKPTPLDWRDESEAICEFTPITRPSASSSGPPELPGLIAASVCSTPEMSKPFGALISRSSAETIPVVTLPDSPNGLPIAIATSPGRSCEEEASSSGLVSAGTLSGSTSSTARSVDASLPTSFAGSASPPSPKRTVNSLPPSTTWSFVTTWPWPSIRKPEPLPLLPFWT